MPSQAVLGIHSAFPEKPKNAFWVSPEKPLGLDSLHAEIQEASQKTKDMFYSNHPPQEVEDHVKHVGYMVSSVIDSRVENLNGRMVRIAELHHDYIENNDAVAADMLADETLSLGFELQNQTQNLMHELGVTGVPLESHLLKGKSELKEIFLQSSLLFPSNWNETISDKLKNIKLLKDESIVFDRQKKFFIGKEENSSAFKTNPYIFKNADKFEIVYGIDGRYAYPSWNAAKIAEENSTLEFHTKHEVVHEMTHMYEKSDYLLSNLTENFLKRRLRKSPEGNFYTYPQYADKRSVTYVDTFTNDLSGMVYDGDFKRNEILPRGTESILLGSNGSFVGLPKYFGTSKEPVKTIPDIDYRNFMLGILFAHKK